MLAMPHLNPDLKFGDFVTSVKTNKLSMDDVVETFLLPQFEEEIHKVEADYFRWVVRRAMKTSSSVKHELQLNVNKHPHDAPVHEVFTDELVEQVVSKARQSLMDEFAIKARTIEDPSFMRQDGPVWGLRPIMRAIGNQSSIRKTFFKNPNSALRDASNTSPCIDIPELALNELVCVEELSGEIPFCVYFHAYDKPEGISVTSPVRFDLSQLRFGTVTRLVNQ